jgi:hypothetical protein
MIPMHRGQNGDKSKINLLIRNNRKIAKKREKARKCAKTV